MLRIAICDDQPAERETFGRFLREECDGRQKTLLIREGGRGRRIAYREIEYIESRRNVLLVRLENGEEHHVYAKLDDVERELADRGFLRCRQSYIVNMDLVRMVRNDFLMASGARIPIRQRGARAIRDAYFEYLLKQAELARNDAALRNVNFAPRLFA